MTHFDNGPAAGQTLMLKRAPKFLRVVEALGVWDALDQLEDKPTPQETIYAYVRMGDPSMCHVNRGSKGSGWYMVANYRLVPEQPTDAQMRDTSAWQEWCLEVADTF